MSMFLNNKVGWLSDSGPDDDITISSRIRLARNLKGLPFPINANEEEARTVIDRACNARSNIDALQSSHLFKIRGMGQIDKRFLLERRLVSKDFINKNYNSELIVKEDESIAIMVNEEDHLRIQAIKSGFRLNEVWDDINELDYQIGKYLEFAFDDKLGFLTSCPTNVGTGMRASVMLHLPALVLSKQITSLIQGVHKLRLTVRGIFGEGSDNLGNLFQVSNQTTLGETEENIILRLEKVIKQIITHEKNARVYLIKEKKNVILDKVGRAYGLLRHAYVLSSKEAINALSYLRLGVDMGMFSAVDIHTVNELFIVTQTSHLQKHINKPMKSYEREILRAKMIREKLKLIEEQ